MGFFDGFLGTAQKRDVLNASKQATDYLTQGYDQARGIGEDYQKRALGYLDPRIASGRDAEAQYRRAIGLDGRDAQRSYYNDFEFDPGYRAQLDEGVRAIDRSAAARGMVNSGSNVNAVADAGRRWAKQAYDDRLTQYNTLMGRGDQAATTAASLTSGFGNELMGMRSGMGQQLAGNAVNVGNAVASTRNIGLQNLLNIGNTAAKFFMPNSTPNQYWTPGTGASTGAAPANSWQTSVNRLY